MPFPGRRQPAGIVRARTEEDSMATSIEPHLWASDFRAVIEWYQTALGFEVTAWSPDEKSAN